ncbi:unnamed protein product [Psylliodes chrysocephalus]|uniref:Glutathione S-transferase n=1 Tax=Psylliodes chrysocephalus TaxID=3402493 RepID=A0A9P0CW63_9CUCU|nr:unnamed protein product [Psylliodes chrysocephala]
MAPTLYYADLSAASRGTLLLVKALGIDVELNPINMAVGEHMTPEYLKINPFHTVPTLKDGDFVLWDSHAINIYLIEKYAPESELYPSDPQKKATINQRLFFDVGIIFPRLATIVVALLREGAKSVSKDKADQVTQAYSLLETLLEKSTYVAGESLTLADLSIVANITSLNILVPLAENRYPKTSEWIARLQKLPYYQEGNEVGLGQFTGMVRSKLA